MKRSILLATLTLFATASLGWAQPLANLAPADTVLSLGMQVRPGMFGTLGDDVAALDWARARETLETLTSVVEERAGDPDLQDLFRLYNAILLSYTDPVAAAAIFTPELATCPAYVEATQAAQEATRDGYSVPVDALLTVGVSSFDPVPTAVALMRVEDETDVQQRSFDAYVSCLEASGDLEPLEQDGATLYIMGDGSDLPLVIGRVDNLYFFGTGPEPLRGVIRRVNGSSEPSFADSALYQSVAALEAGEGQLSLTLDFAALAEVLQGFGSAAASSPEEDYLLERGVAFLRTLGGYAGVLSATPEGLLFENVTAVNPAGGDAALASLLLCEACSVGSPFLAPAGSVAATVSRLPLEDLFNYVQGLLDGAPPSMDVSVNLRDVLREEFDFDVDVALFDWLGTEGYSAVLEPVSTDLRTLLYGQEQVAVIPVSSREAAEAGFEEFRRVLTPLFEEALASEDDPTLSFLTQIASESVTYKGETYTRYRYSLNGDIGVGFLDNYLVTSTPASALETLIDVFKGDAESLLETESYQSATESTPTSVLGRGYVDVGTQYEAAADFFDLFSQPAAFAVSVGLATLSDTSFDDTDTSSLDYDADLTGIEAAPVDASLSPTLRGSFTNEAYGARYYSLTELNAGDEVTVTLSGLSDAILSLIDEGRSVYTDESYAVGSDAVLTFTAEADVTYWLEILNYSEGTESYTLNVTRTPGSALATETVTEEVEPTEPPSFGDLLQLTGLVPATLRIVGGHVGVNSSYTETRDGAIYHRSFTRIDW